MSRLTHHHHFHLICIFILLHPPNPISRTYWFSVRFEWKNSEKNLLLSYICKTSIIHAGRIKSPCILQPFPSFHSNSAAVATAELVVTLRLLQQNSRDADGWTIWGWINKDDDRQPASCIRCLPPPSQSKLADCRRRRRGDDSTEQKRVFMHKQSVKSLCNF